MSDLPVGEGTASGYLALPASGSGPGVLVLHAWWGLNAFMRGVCDRLAAEGFVAFAPDMYRGDIAATVAEAEVLSAKTRDIGDIATGAAAYLRGLPAVGGRPCGALGFSLGAYWGVWLAQQPAADLAAIVLFYGGPGGEFDGSRAAYQAHFAGDDPYEPSEGVEEFVGAARAAGREVEVHTYPDTGHWFFEEDRPDAYDAEAAVLAWERAVEFLRARLGK